MRRSQISVVLVGIAVMILSPFARVDMASAASGTCYFASPNSYVLGTTGCAITDYGSYGTNDVLSGRVDASGTVMPTSSVGSKGQFISIIKGRFSSGSTQDKVGAAFIIQLMRGSRSWPTSADVTNWESMMNQSNVTYHSLSNVSVSYSSWYDPAKRNTFFDSRSAASRDVVEIRQNGIVRMQIQRACANPTGSYSPLAEPVWNITGTSSANRSTARPGDQIKWSHTVRNNGPDTTSPASIASNTLRSGGTSAWNRSANSASGVMTNGATRAPSSTHTVVNDDVGKTLCERVQWTPRSSSSSATGNSTPACVTILPHPWSTSGTSTRTLNNDDRGVATPGEIARWRHTLTLHQNQNHLPIVSHTVATGFSNGWNGAFNSTTTPAWRSVGVIRTITSAAGTRTEYRVTQDDVGNTLCQHLSWTPVGANSAGTTLNGPSTSTPACITVPFNYTLQPRIDLPVTDDSMVEPGSTVNVDRIVTNSGPTKSRDTEWQVSELIVNPGTAVPNRGGGDSTQTPCLFFRPASGACATIGNGTGTFNPGDMSLGRVDQLIQNLEVGARVCWGLSVRPYKHDSPAGEWRHSRLMCVTVGKRPRVQLWGADVRSAGRVAMTPSNINSRMYGSWAEYAIVSANSVAFASGAGLSAPSSGRSTVPTSYNTLTYANTPSYGGYGTITPATVPAEYTSMTGAMAGTPLGSSSITPNDLDSGMYVHSGNLELSASTLTAGKRLVIKAGGTITISGDITYADGPYGSIADIPQLILSANNIVVASGVNRVDAWLIANRNASSYVSTCDAVTGNWLSGLNAFVCNTELRLNGPIIANHLYLRRTAGANVEHRGRPAEIVNLRPDAYMFALSDSQSFSSIRTMYSRELPPRY